MPGHGAKGAGPGAAFARAVMVVACALAFVVVGLTAPPAPRADDAQCTVIPGGGVTAQRLTGSGHVTLGGNLTLTDPAQTSTLARLSLSNGTLDGPGSVTVTDRFEWPNGTLSGSGTTTIAPGATGSVTAPSGSLVTLNGRKLVNQGQLTWASGSIWAANGAQIQNAGTLDANADGDNLSWSYGAQPTLSNTGTIEKTAGTGTVDVGLPFDNEGDALVDGGRLRLTGGGITATGSTTLGGGTTLGGSGTTRIEWAIGRRGTVNASSGSIDFSGSFNTRMATEVDGSGDPPEETPEDILMPGGEPVGTPSEGGDDWIRNVPGGEEAAEDYFFRLGENGTENTPEGYDGIGVDLLDGGFVGIRPESGSGDPTIDVNIPGIPDVRKIHLGF